MKTIFNWSMTTLIVGSAILLGVTIATLGLIVDEINGPDSARD